MKPLEYAKIKLKPVAKVSAFFNFAVGDDIEFVSRSKRIETIGVKKDCNNQRSFDKILAFKKEGVLKHIVGKITV